MERGGLKEGLVMGGDNLRLIDDPAPSPEVSKCECAAASPPESGATNGWLAKAVSPVAEPRRSHRAICVPASHSTWTLLSPALALVTCESLTETL